MHSYLTIIYSDLKHTRRDPTLLLMLFVPFIMVAVLQFGLPALTAIFPIISNYFLAIVTFFVVMTSLFPGFIIAFILLDEKDLHLFPVIKATPLSLSGLLLARIAFIVVIGICSSLIIIFFNGLIEFTIGKALQLAFLSALNAPIITLLIATIAKNKVEGLTLLKLANITILIPAAILFIDSPWENILAIFPTFWIYKLVETSEHTNAIFMLGTFVLIALNYLSLRFAVRKN